MNCQACGYALWNLDARACPECATAFLPSDFEFVPGTVQFRCPRCRHARLGTDDRGHLTPRSFTCEQCGAAIDMDAMALAPADGLTPADTEPGAMPWLERGRRGTIKGFFGTVGLAMIHPARLMRGVPKKASVGEALGFGMGTAAVAFMTGIALPVAGYWIWNFFVWGWAPDVWEIYFLAFWLFIAFFVVVGTIPVWALATHAVLRLTGGARFSVDRTLQAVGYSAGATVVGAIPFAGAPLAILWWSISAVFMVAGGQKVHAGRVVIAVFALPMLVVLASCGLYVLAVWSISRSMTAGMGGAGWSTQTYAADAVHARVLTNTFMNDGDAPAHALELVTAGNFTNWEFDAPVGNMFCYYDSLTTSADVPVGEGTLETFSTLNREKQSEVVATLVEGMPEGVIAHRVGDFVFTYHGASLIGRNSQLWVVVMIRDPDSNGPPQPWDTVLIGADVTGDSMMQIDYEDFAGELREQNRYRATIGLAPLPDLSTVTHGSPAVAP